MSKSAIGAAFVENAPPGELADVVADIQAIEPSLVASLGSAFKKYNHEQYTTVKLPGASQPVIVSSYNALDDGRYYDPESKTSFAFDHATGKASATQSYVHEGPQAALIDSTLKSLSKYVSEYFPSASYSAYSKDNALVIVIVANKYSPNNFWNGRWRSCYRYEDDSLSGEIKVDVHYYEDGNVRLSTNKPVSASVTASAVVKEIGTIEKKYQEDLNRGFNDLSEGAFKGLRRQLPVTRQKVEWEKISGYKLGQDIGGGRTR